eukprot:TRINITY_DN61435_c0_g1_i1.p1 TRINITY_DN61435_c0_g1~~TRINITY_DN61435_c0_g1_i1.p1  ORF type:complete len:389 (-),score=84.90 TRINITY_DN61435_c0_g1_i1:107-1273(-)
MSSMNWLGDIVALVNVASMLAAASDLDQPSTKQILEFGAATAQRACISGGVGIPGSSFIQKMEHAAAAYERLPLAEQALVEETAKIRHSADATATSFHGGQVDRAVNDLFVVFFVVALLLVVMVLAFIFLDSSYKKRPSGGYLAGDYQESTGRSAGPPREARSPRTRSGLQAPRAGSPGGGSGAASPPSPRLATNSEAEPKSLYLCGRELVVPDQNECNLIVPSIQYQYLQVDKSELFINDTEGSSILRGVIFKKAQPDGTRIMLQSRDGNITWGRCIDTGRKTRFKLSGRSDDPEKQNWGTIEMKQGGAMSLTTSNGHKVKFEQSPGLTGRRNVLRIVDGYGVLLCLSEMSVGGRAVRVGPLVDIGFVMLSHLAMDVFQLEEFGELR